MKVLNAFYLERELLLLNTQLRDAKGIRNPTSRKTSDTSNYLKIWHQIECTDSNDIYWPTFRQYLLLDILILPNSGDFNMFLNV